MDEQPNPGRGGPIGVLCGREVALHGLLAAMVHSGIDACEVASAAVEPWLTAHASGFLLLGQADDRLASLVRRSEANGSRVLVLVSSSTITDYRTLLRAGAVGVLSDSDSTEGLLAGVQAALHGRTLLPTAIAQGLATQVRSMECKCRNLGVLDLKLVALLATGRSVVDASVELSRSERDCYRSLARVRSILAVRNGAEMVAHLVACDRLNPV